MALSIHIIAGAIGLMCGYIALFAAKGGTVHRRSGLSFVYAMVVMGLMGATIAAVWDVAPAGNVPSGVLTAYLAITGWRTLRSQPPAALLADWGLAVVSFSIAVVHLGYGAEAVASGTGARRGVPAFAFLLFGSVALLVGLGDLRLLHRGGVQVLRGAPRIARHLWRVTFALLVAAFSFFLGQAKLLPKSMRIYPLLALPVLVVLVSMLYWLWRVRKRKDLRAMIGIQLLDQHALPARQRSACPLENAGAP